MSDEMMDPAPAEEMNKTETDPMMEKKADDKKDEDKKSEDDGPKEAAHEPVLTSCCCCLCACSNNLTDKLSCCGCFPIKCGIMAIGIFTFVLTIILVTYNFFFILNEFVAWYFPVVVLVLLIPLVIATFFWVVWFIKDDIGARRTLQVACQLTIVSLTLSCVWTLCYFIWLYKKDSVYTGYGDPEVFTGYHKTPKKVYLFTILAETIVLVLLYAYWLCICDRYYDAMLQKEEEEEEDEEMMMGDDKKEEKMEEKKDEAPAEMEAAEPAEGAE